MARPAGGKYINFLFVHLQSNRAQHVYKITRAVNPDT